MTAEFRSAYIDALRAYLAGRDEASLEVGHELGRRALAERISTLDIVENHFRLLGSGDDESEPAAALQFLLQTLAALDVATRGFLDGTQRYEQQRARADGLADRDQFRTALVNALQEGFFVADGDGTVVEINDAFTEITGYDAAGLPYRWPHPWLVDHGLADRQLDQLIETGDLQAETEIRRRDGAPGWAAVSINAVPAAGSARAVYVGTIRDVTVLRAAAERERLLARLATAIGLAKSMAEVLAITLEECRAAIDLQRVLTVTWRNGDEEPAVRAAGEPAGGQWSDLDPDLRTTLGQARQWPPLTIEPVLSPDGSDAACGIVAMLPGAGDTAVVLEHQRPRQISVDDRLLLTALVGHLGLAIQHVRQFETAREASLTLQRAMLPTSSPPAGFAVRYEPAVAPLEIGGDWYDVLPISERTIGIVVGDCVGRGLPAAAVMGQLRSSARALLLTGAEPAVLLEELDSAAALIPHAYCATVFLAVLDVRTGELRYSSAGHVPAVLATPASPPSVLSDAGAVPLAVRRNGPRPQATRTLPPGSALLLYTDGLVERRDAPIDDGIDRVTRVLAAELSSHADTIADAVLRELAPPAGYDDDVAVLVYRRPPAPLHLEIAATPANLGRVRTELTAWLTEVGAGQELTTDVVLAVNEACTNSVEHGYRDVAAGVMVVDAAVWGDEIVVRVLDFGTWKTPDEKPRTRGRGLPMMRAVSARVDLGPSASGTTVEMVFRLTPG
ncbi:SpoIIE family protein phosphatase [Mycobacterium sp. CPCC 205372]|uniref:SpoIIE family protein phosphatase n=1 Tax=Mycobacterium hippophais TaxID=3016340 RepID=A0ABT4PXX4_9MYCO|nr:SpoIIE family protein phosphatase [Mycobacterium hippophais]MCZ8381442.1 SpoIIE family protein phosphatase [Mycobacterium hippophais]